MTAHLTGLPVMRPMPIAFPHDPGVAYLDRQYMLGPDILVAPVFSEGGDVEFYLPAGGWTSLLTGERVIGGGWRRERHALDSLPLYVRDGAVIARGARVDRPDYDYLDGLVLEVYPGAEGEREVEVHTIDGVRHAFSLAGATLTASSATPSPQVRIVGADG
jgi:alpha-D-xyloside xylohydrolase